MHLTSRKAGLENCAARVSCDKFPPFQRACTTMNSVAGGETAEYVYIARRNNSLSSSARLTVFGLILTVSLGIAAGFAVVFGAWPIMPFAGIEMVVLYLAFRYMDRHAGDYESITIRDDKVAVEVCEGADVRRFEL